MKTSTNCPNCGSPQAQASCNSCGSVLSLKLSDVHLLREEVLKFQIELGDKSQQFLRRINLLEKKQLALEKEKSLELPQEPKTKTEEVVEKPPEKKPVMEKNIPLPIVPVPNSPLKAKKPIITSPYSTTSQPKAIKTPVKTKTTPSISRPISPPKNAEPPFLLSLLLSPFHQGINYIKGVFDHYKEAGRLPVFFLSLGGIIAILFGVGYLMQLGINYFIEILSAPTLEVLKVSFAMLTASTILLFGVRFSKKADKYRDFGSALLGLGVAVFYLTFYFLPHNTYFPLFEEPLFSLGLISLTACVGSFLALKYETRVLAVISFLGAALIPLFMNAHVLGELYLGFLGFLSISTLFVARRISWKPLQMICLVLVLGVVEWMVYASGSRISAITLLVALHGFAYLFIINALWKKTGLLKVFRTEDIFMVSSTLSLLIINALSLANQQGLDALVGWIFMGNALLWGLFCGLSFYKLSESLRWLCFLISGAFFALAAFLLLDQNYLALGLGIEGVLLLTFGFKFVLPRVRWEAYALLSFVFARCLYGMRNFVADWEMGIWSDSFMHLLILGGVIAASLFLLRKFALLAWEKDLKYILSEALFIWTIGTILLIVSKYIGVFTFNFALVPMIFMMYWGNKQKLMISERLGWLMGLSFIVAYLLSASSVGNLHFHAQTWGGKIAAIEGFGVLWLIQFLYKQWDEDSDLYTFAKGLRNFFFVLLPIIYLPSVARRFPEFLPYAGWFSVLAAYMISRFRQRMESILETHVLVFVASVLMFFPLHLMGVVSGILALGIIYGADKAYVFSHHRKSPFKHIHTYSFWYLALAGVLAMLRINDDLLMLSSPFLAIYFLVLYYNRAKIAPLKKYASLLYRSHMIGAVICLTILAYLFAEEQWVSGIEYSFVASTGILTALALGFWSQLHKVLGQKEKYALKLQTRFLFIQILTFLSYASMWNLLTDNSFGMGLTLSLFVHAILLLFFATQKGKEWIQRLAFLLLAMAFAKLILFDFRNFDLLYKVGVSILSGAMMLLGARMYLRGSVER